MAGFGLNLKLVLYLQSQCLTESLGFLNPPLLQAAKRWQKILTSVVGKSLVVFELNKEIEETVSILTGKNLKQLSQDGSTLFEIIL